VPDVARGERALIVAPEFPREGSRRDAEARLEEAEGLAEAIGIVVVAERAFRLRTIRPATLLGKGQVEEVAGLAEEHQAGLLIVDAPLSPVQQKNLEEEVGTKVIDRTRADPRDFRRARRHRRGPAAGRACAPPVSGGPSGAQLDPPGAAARRFRFPRRSR
jgi:predicted GTPase